MIKVLKAGFYATIQDKGRVGFAAQGVPISGVMDSFSANMANGILDNSIEDAVLEVAFGGVALQFLSSTFIAISGANFRPILNNKPVKLNTRIQILENDVLSFGTATFGVRCYLAVKNGFKTEKVLGSRSQFKNITTDFRIKKGAILSIEKSNTNLKTTYSSLKVNENHFNTNTIFCTKGPEFDMLDAHQQQKLYNQIFTISKDQDRMGFRLNEVIKNKLPSILTSSVLPGTVQLTPLGKLIVLMRDCQVTGGYPRILQLTEQSIAVLSQKTNGDSIVFSIN